jgi:hypothetical protein
MKGKPWTPEQVRILRDLYPHKRTVDIVDAVGHPVNSIYQKAAQIDIHKTQEFMNSEACGQFVKGKQNGARSQFAKGGIPWNKGMKGLQIGGESTKFKKGNTPLNHKPVGTVVIRADGYSKTKIAEPNVWELTHRVVWMQEGRELPAHPAVIRFKDGNPQNCGIENLEVSSKIAMMAANSVQVLPTNLRRAIHLHGVLIRKINGK